MFNHKSLIIRISVPINPKIASRQGDKEITNEPTQPRKGRNQSLLASVFFFLFGLLF